MVLSKYERRLEKAIKDWGENPMLIFRGQGNRKWKLESSADRRLREAKSSLSLVEYLTEHLIKPARNEGYARRQDGELNDLELLATLQHQGAATCLLDFTSSFHIALWFACQNIKRSGFVFIVDRGDINSFREVTPEQAKDGIKNLLQPKDTTQRDKSESTLLASRSDADSHPIYYWQPPPNENRIVVQHSCFIFSARPIEGNRYKQIIIDRKDKESIKESLKLYYGLERRTVFRDFTGFASSHGQREPITQVRRSLQWLQSGNRHFQQGKYKDAIASYSEAIGLNPKFAEAYNNRGNAKFSLGQYEPAVADYDKAIDLNSQYAQAHNNRGTAKVNLGQYEQAVVDFDKAISLNLQYAQAYYNRGTAKVALGQYEEAIADFDKAISLSPQDAEAYCNRGTAKVALGQYEEAIADFDKAISLNPQYAQAYHNRGIAKDELGQH